MNDPSAHQRAAWDRVTAITVTYNSAAVVERCLASVAGAARVIVVDNASSDDTVRCVHRVLATAEIIDNKKNLGFGRANNLGLHRTETEFALLINPDATLRSEALSALVAAADQYPEAALVAPALHRGDGRLWLSHDVSYMRRPHFPRKRDMEAAPSGPFCTWSLSGAAMLLRMNAMREVGFFDPAIFLYFEDNDLCERVRAGGYTLIQAPDAVVEHLEGRSTAPSLRTVWLTNRSFAWSRLYFIRKHWGRAVAWRVLIKLLPRFLLRFFVRGLTFRWKRALAAAAHVEGMLLWCRTRD